MVCAHCDSNATAPSKTAQIAPITRNRLKILTPILQTGRDAIFALQERQHYPLLSSCGVAIIMGSKIMVFMRGLGRFFKSLT